MATELITIESAGPSDLSNILALLEKNGLPTEGLADHIETAMVAHEAGQVVGSAALELYGHTALLRSVAVEEHLRGHGLGQRLTQAALDHARTLGVTDVYLLTETAGGFFPRFGFHPITRAEVPVGVQQSIEFTFACADTALVMTKHL
ncbi:MAG: arsenic resistance N-acetyltransferase ArsN2 [Chloroflexia bacterium]